MAIFDVTSYGAAGNYDYSNDTGTNDAPAFAAAVAAAKAAGGGTVYVPGGKQYLLSSAGDAMNYPDSIIPIFDDKSIRFVGDPLGKGGSKLVIGVDKDVFRVGYGDGTGDWQGVPIDPRDQIEGYEISGLTILPRKGFYATNSIVFHVFNAIGADIHHFNIAAYGAAYAAKVNGQAGSGIIATPGPGSFYALWPNGYTHQGQSLNGLPMAQLPRPGVPQRTSNTGPAGSDPRGWDNVNNVQIKGWASADMGRLCTGTKMHGNSVYKNVIHDGQINCVLVGCEVGVYDDHNDIPQGCIHRDLIVQGCVTAACVQYAGDGSNVWQNIYSFQHKCDGFRYIIPAAASYSGLTYGVAWINCGSDYVGGHGFWVDGTTTGGSQKCLVDIKDWYAAGSGVPENNAAVWPTWAAKKGVLLDNNHVSELEMHRGRCIINGQDGAEITCTRGNVWDNLFGYNAQALAVNNGSALYVNNNSNLLNIQRNSFMGGTFGSFSNNQGYGLYVNNTNITITVLSNNVALNNTVAQYQNGITPTTSGLNT